MMNGESTVSPARRRVHVDSLFSRDELRSICPKSRLPLSQQIYVLLRHKILSGDLEYGTIFPGELPLANALGVSRITIGMSMKWLQEDALIRRARGIGSYVVFDHPKTLEIDSLDHTMSRSAKVEVLEIAPGASLDAKASAHGDRRIDDGLVYALRLHSDTDGGPYAVEESWTRTDSNDLFALLAENSPRRRFLRNLGITEAAVHQSIAPSFALVGVAELLGILPFDPVLHISRHALDGNGETVDFCRVSFHPERCKITVRLPHEPVKDRRRSYRLSSAKLERISAEPARTAL